MIKIHENFFYRKYEYFYLFVMVIYMAQMVPETSRMAGNLSGNPIPFLIPIVLTAVLIYRNPINFFHRNLWVLVAVMLCWTVAICYKFHDFSSSNLSFYFFLFYAIFIAFIHIRVYGRDLFPLYEHIMVVLASISLMLWGITIIPGFRSLFQLFPNTVHGNNVLYLYHSLDPSIGHAIGFFVRNAGCSWEPGRFAIMLVLAILVNLARKGITFQNNKNIIILLLALVSTFSTTGYSITILLYSIFWFDKLELKKILTFFIIVLPFTIFLFSLDFMGAKIQDRAKFGERAKERMIQINYYEETRGNEYIASLDRFESANFEWMNFLQDPLLGYGRNLEHSWFRSNISANMVLTGGFVKIFSQYGIFVGLFLYVLLFYSSFKAGLTYLNHHRLALATVLLVSSISYPIFSIPVYTSFWFYGLFCYKYRGLFYHK